MDDITLQHVSSKIALVRGVWSYPNPGCFGLILPVYGLSVPRLREVLLRYPMHLSRKPQLLV